MATPIIGIDASRAVGRVRTGTENYSREIIRGLLNQPADFDWRLYFNGSSNAFELPEHARSEVRDIPSRRLWTHLRLSRELLANRVSGLFVPAHVVPLYHPPSVVTIHDLGYLHWPDAHPTRQRVMLDLTTRWSARVSRHIIVPSQQTANDLQQFYNVPESKITVVHHGVDRRMSPSSDATDSTLRQRLGIRGAYVLAVGTVHPRKNLPVLARAMRSIVKGHDVDLVIAGRKGWMFEQVRDELQQSGLGDRLVLLDYVSSDDLPALYRNAELFVQPSKFEGFGMPVLEAMACGTAVISAHSSSLSEIGGEAAIHFCPTDETELTHLIDRTLSNSKEKLAVIERGIAWSARFTWEHAAAKTRIILQEHLLKQAPALRERSRH